MHIYSSTGVILIYFFVLIVFSFEVNEMQRVLTLVAYRNGGTYGNVSLFFYALNLEAQLGLDFNVTSSVSWRLSMWIFFPQCI